MHTTADPNAERRLRRTHFQFKQFRIEQDACAMKVSSDACLFGASLVADEPRRGLDIGTGTGLLALMLAQRFEKLVVDAVERDGAAAAQACSNARESRFSARIDVHHADIQSFVEQRKTEAPYDLIVCNPPFFVNSSESRNAERALARHAGDLNIATLLQLAAQVIAPTGILWAMLPFADGEAALALAQSEGWSPLYVFQVRHSPERLCHRVFLGLTRAKKGETVTAVRQLLETEGGGRHYTELAERQLRPFYLHIAD